MQFFLFWLLTLFCEEYIVFKHHGTNESLASEWATSSVGRATPF